MKDMINVILCSFNIHRWEYIFKKYFVAIRLKEKTKVSMPYRFCKMCNKKQIRTMLPLCNGIDLHNKWINVE